MKLYIKEGRFEPVCFFNYPGLLCLECTNYSWCWDDGPCTHIYDNKFSLCDLFNPYSTYVF